MNFNLPNEIDTILRKLDAFVETTIKPIQAEGDNERFFDHRREWARTDWDAGGTPRQDWEDLLARARTEADQAGYLRLAMPAEYGGRDIGNLAMAVIREHLAAKGLGLHNDLQNEHSIVANLPQVLMFRDYGTAEQQADFIPHLLDGSCHLPVALTEPEHGSDATFMETTAVPCRADGEEGYLITGEKMWTSGMHRATHCLVFARTGGDAGDASGITSFIVPADAPGFEVVEYLWTFNMPTDHPLVRLQSVWVPANAMLGELGRGLNLAQHFVHENRIRQAASSLGAASYCVEQSVAYANARKPFGKPLSANQAIQWPLVELATQVEMLRLLIRKTAWEMDQIDKRDVARELSHKVSMCNFWANRLVCEAADVAMQVHGGLGYSRHKPFEHIYRHHRRYRITEGSEEIQKRKVAAQLFGIGKSKVA